MRAWTVITLRSVFGGEEAQRWRGRQEELEMSRYVRVRREYRWKKGNSPDRKNPPVLRKKGVVALTWQVCAMPGAAVEPLADDALMNDALVNGLVSGPLLVTLR